MLDNITTAALLSSPLSFDCSLSMIQADLYIHPSVNMMLSRG